MARDPAFNTITRTARPVAGVMAQAAPYDALAAPTGDDLLAASLSFWPTGPAWGTPDGQALSITSALARFTRVLISDFVWLYGRSWQLAREATVQGVIELLPEWEQDHGLPERCFADTVPSSSQRIDALARKVRAEAINHPEDFVRLALDYGFEIEIEEPAIFTCGFSEVGGKHELGSFLEETYWIVRVRDASINYFEAGVGEVGYDPLFSFGAAEQILCLLRQMAPAWTLPALQPWINLAGLVTEDGVRIVDEYGNWILVTTDL